jgi:predicted nucleic acid-binding protein
MSTFAAPIYAEANREHLLAEFARLRTLLSGDQAPAAGTLPWECDQPPAADILTAIFDLSPFERDLLLLCAAVEMEADLGELCGRLTGRPQRNSPTFGLALSLMPNPDWRALAPASPLRYFRLVDLEPGFGLAAAPLRIDERILHFLAGSNRMDARLQSILRFEPPTAPLAEDHQELLDSLLRDCDARPESISLHLHGDDPAAQRAIAARIAQHFDRHLLILRAENAPAAGADLEQFLALWSREALLLPAFLLLDWHGDAPIANLRALAERIPTTLLIASRDAEKLHRLTWRHEVNCPDPTAQRRMWQLALAAVVPAKILESNAQLDTALDRMAEQFRMSADTIATVAAAVANEPDSLAERLWQNCRAVSRPQLDLLAERISPRAAWDDLVLPDAETAVLKMLVSQARNRMTVYEHWGFASRGRRGLGMSALFSGPSGTGKTLAAEVLAAELDLDLYRIDLSAVVSKFIGETEKNLKKVFDAAEQGGVVMLFDEAEALFGKRSEVRDSHDRYANIEVGYLLQRMEQFQGVAILTTNTKASLDKAFQRRLRFSVDFPYPGAAERERIWRRAIPSQTPSSGIDPARLAQLHMTGGNIRNIALNAAFLAAEKGQPLSMSHLREAANLEAAKTERPIAATETRGWE